MLGVYILYALWQLVFTQSEIKISWPAALQSQDMVTRLLS